MSIMYPSRRQGGQLLLNALSEGTPSAAMVYRIIAADSASPPLSSASIPSIPALACPTDRIWSHYAASTSTPALHFSARHFSSSMHRSAAGRHQVLPPPKPGRRGPNKTKDGVRKPPIVLTKARSRDSSLADLPETPPWQEASVERLSKELQAYKTDLALAKTKRNNTNVLPFLDEAVAGVVEAEREVLASSDSTTRITGRTFSKRLGFAQMGALLQMTESQGTQPQPPVNSTAPTESSALPINSHQYESLWTVQSKEYKQAQEMKARRKEKPLSEDAIQLELAAHANQVVNVITTIELLLPLLPSQRRAVSRAVVQSTHKSHHEADAAGAAASAVHAEHPITAHSARTAVTFLLNECGLSHRQAAETIAAHPWILGIHSIRSRCAGVLEALHLIDMKQDAIAAVIAAHPPALLLNADADIIPLLEYLTGLGFRESEAAGLIQAAPKILLSQGAVHAVSGNVAFWVGRGMPRAGVRALLTAAPEVSGMGFQLLQLKVDWLMQHAEFSVQDFAEIPAAVRLPLTAVVAPRLAFARHCGVSIPPPSKSISVAADSAQSPQNLDLDFILSSSDTHFLKALGATDAEYRGFEAAWRDSDLRRWLHSRVSGAEVSQYESLDWVSEEEMEALREVHDHHVALREMAWEQQHDREKEWEMVWNEWKRGQVRRDQLANWNKRAKKKREVEALRRASLELSMITELQAEKKPGMCTKSPYCNRVDNHPGICNQKLVLKIDFDDSSMVPLNSSASGQRVGGKGDTVNEAATLAEIQAGIYLLGPPKEDLGTGEEGLGSDAAETLIFGGDAGPAVTKDEIESQDIETVLKCAEGIVDLLRNAPAGALTDRTVNSWAERHGYSKACTAAGKGVVAATGQARVVVEPNWNYYKVAPKAWQLLGRPAFAQNDDESQAAVTTAAAAEQPLRLTRTSANILVLSTLILRHLDSSPSEAIKRSDLRSWAEVRWKGASKHIRAAVAGLVEQGLVVHRRQKGMVTGPMEVVRVDLDRYLDALPPSMLNPSFNAATSTGGSFGHGPTSGGAGFGPAGDERSFDYSTMPLPGSLLKQQHRIKLEREAMIVEFGWDRFESVPVKEVQEAANAVLSMLREEPTGVLSNRAINAMATREKLSREALTAAKAVLYSTGQAVVWAEAQNVEQLDNGSFGHSVPLRFWARADVAQSVLANKPEKVHSSHVLAKAMLDELRRSPGGFMQRHELRDWARYREDLRWGETVVFHLAACALIESGTIMQARVFENIEDVNAVGGGSNVREVVEEDASEDSDDAETQVMEVSGAAATRRKKRLVALDMSRYSFPAAGDSSEDEESDSDLNENEADAWHP